MKFIYTSLILTLPYFGMANPTTEKLKPSQAPPTEVEPALQIFIEPANLLAHLESALQESIVLIDTHLELDFVRKVKPIPIAAKAFKLQIPNHIAADLKSRFMLSFSIFQDGKEVYESSAYVKAKLMKEVWIAAERLHPNQPVDEGMLSMDVQDVLSQSGEPVPISEQLPEYLARYAVMPGRALMKHHVRRRPVFQRGDMIEAIYKRGALRIALKAECLQEAAPGSIVRLRNPNTKKQINGYVNEDKSVTIL